MISYMNYSQAKMLVSIFENMIKFGTINDKYMMADILKNKAKRSNKIDHFHQNPFVFSVNPIKEYAMVINILMILRRKFADIKYISNDLIKFHSTAINEILKATDDIRIVRNSIQF